MCLTFIIRRNKTVFKTLNKNNYSGYKQNPNFKKWHQQKAKLFLNGVSPKVMNYTSHLSSKAMEQTCLH